MSHNVGKDIKTACTALKNGGDNNATSCARGRLDNIADKNSALKPDGTKNDDDDDDLYANIDVENCTKNIVTRSATTSTSSFRTATIPVPTKHVKGPRNMTEEIEYCHKTMKVLQKENEVLKRNIGILYRTAIHEIQRNNNTNSQKDIRMPTAATTTSMYDNDNDNNDHTKRQRR